MCVNSRVKINVNVAGYMLVTAGGVFDFRNFLFHQSNVAVNTQRTADMCCFSAPENASHIEDNIWMDQTGIFSGI